MKDELRKLIRYRNERAHEILSDAKILINNNRLLSAINRLYYAAFYAVQALLLTKNLSSAKHSGIRSLFQQQFVKEGIISKELGRFYNQLYKNRQKSDYEDYVQFDKEQADGWYIQTADFIKVMSRTIDKYLSE